MGACSTTCCRCGRKFDRFSGFLINLSDSALKEYYALPFLQEYLNTVGHKHPTLCSDCLSERLGRDLHIKDFKFKNKRWMTSNVAYIIKHRDIPQDNKESLLSKLRSMDNSGVIDIKIDHEGIMKFKEEFLN